MKTKNKDKKTNIVVNKNQLPMFGYELSYNDKIKTKQIKFTKDIEIPLDMIQEIIKSCQKVNLKNKEVQLGISIMIPNTIAKKGMFGKKNGKQTFIAKKVKIKNG